MSIVIPLLRRRGTILVVLLSGLLSFSLSEPLSGDDPELLVGRDYVRGEVIFAFREGFMPTQAALSRESCRVGITGLDNILATCRAKRLRKLTSTRDAGGVSAEARRFERTFRLKFSGPQDAQDIASAISQEPCIEYAVVNRILEKEYYGLKRLIPDSATEFNHQWYFDSTNDKLDIDIPEAWAIERGDSEVVIVINDTGTLVLGFDPTDCADESAWELIEDFNYLWLAAEDSASPGVLKNDDINGTDADGDSVADNIIGANFSPPPDTAHACEVAMWAAVPNDIWVRDAENPRDWYCFGYHSHGVKVASVAAARWSNHIIGGDVVGAANQCKVYWTRAGGISATTVGDEAQSIEHSAYYADVINMSWGLGKKIISENDSHLLPLKGAIAYAAAKDCVLVAAVGNNQYSDWVPFPARFSDVLAVGAVEKLGDSTLVHKSNDPVLGQASGYSNYQSDGQFVDVVAPVHAGIWADLHPDDCEPPCPPPCDTEPDANETAYGTSFAAPQASGIAALIRSRFRHMKQDSVRARIKRAAEFYSEWESEQYAVNKYGAGKINAYRSITEWGRVSTGSGHAAEWGGQREGWPDSLYVSGDLFVETGDTLILNPGTVVCVAAEPISHNEGTGYDASRVEIIVRGTLLMGSVGTGPVVFKSFPAGTPTASDWAGIRFEEGSRGVLKNVRIENAVEDVVIDEFDVTVADWHQTKELYLNSDLSITSDRTIAASDSLFVLGASDVVLTAGAGVDITVNGSLICRGSESKKPEFRSSTGASSSWGLITLASGSENNEFTHTIIRDAQLAIRNYVPLSLDGCLIAEGIDGIQAYASLTVSNSTLSDLTSSAIRLYAGNLAVAGTTIQDCGYGIDQSAQTSTGSIACTNSAILRCEDRGINVTGPSGGVTIRRTTVEDATEGMLFAYQDQVTVDSCTVRRTDIGVCSVYGLDTMVRYSALDSNLTTGILAFADSATVLADTVTNSAAGVYVYGTGGGIGEHTRLANNAVGLKCDNSSNPTVRDSRIHANTDGVVALNGSNPDLGDASADTCTGGPNEGRNSIHDNSGYDVANLTQGVTVSAGCDWWGGVPQAGKFSGAVDHDPYLSSDPNPAGGESMPVSPGPQEQPDRQPTRYALGPNHPNPCNPVTTIGFDVPSPGGRVTIAIYDVRGARVRTLVNGYRPVGTHTAIWDGRDDRGAPAASGVYFMRMTAPAFVQTRKVVLLK